MEVTIHPLLFLIHPLSINLNPFIIFAPASRFIGLTINVSQESPGNAGHRAS
ncbi:hypothetical protein G0Q07_16260 [Draconibacterium halophilum]|uniref:Uncharacterized protein n=1 Tax=Draconibacterium halophilum TaxID=2706887 RepID=A0A6C0R8N0_9BACT|nr:hypothetical protein G0Q07_16260 [Draconibacterium halophilum]